MFAILAEDDSDAEALTHLVRRRVGTEKMQIKSKGYDGCSAMCRKGARDVRAWVQAGVSKIIVCHDADRNPAVDIRQRVRESVIRPSGFTGPSCITVPVEEIEAWIIADEKAVNTVIPKFGFSGHPRPETISNPKEWLRDQSRASNGKPLYSPKTFNPIVARHLRFDVVSNKCPSFKVFVAWLDKNKSNKK